MEVTKDKIKRHHVLKHQNQTDMILPLGMADTKRFLHHGLFLSDFSSSLSFRSSICRGMEYVF